jgi:hypothetical protein
MFNCKKALLGLLTSIALSSPLYAQINNPSGSFPPSGCSTANGVIFNNAVSCNSNFTANTSGNVTVVSITAPYGIASAPPISIGATNTGFYGLFPISRLAATIAGAPVVGFDKVNGVTFSTGGYGIGWLNSTIGTNTTDLSIGRDTANILAVSAGGVGAVTATGASVRVNNVWNSSTSFERGIFGWTDISNVLTIGTQVGSGGGTARNMQFVTGGTLALTINAAQSAIFNNAAIATNATDGFIYIASGAGTPMGTPTTATGRVPLYIDTTNSQLWLYMGGAWKQPKTPAGAATITWQ